MYIAYYDEAGDDGYPKCSSRLFILSCIYLNKDVWKETYQNILNFRKNIRELYGLPVKYEFHTKQFLLNKKPYRQYNFSDEIRIEIIEKFIEFLSTQKIQIINVVIDKNNIPNDDYKVLKTAFTYSIQRIENTLYYSNSYNKEEAYNLLSKYIQNESDLKKIHQEFYTRWLNDKNFIIITDEGRLHSMCKIAREIQKINYIPTQYEYSPYRDEIKLLIEDPIAKESKESCFIQVADFMSYILHLFMTYKLEPEKLPNRLPEFVTKDKVKQWMENLKPILNLKASSSDSFGIVYYPKK